MEGENNKERYKADADMGLQGYLYFLFYRFKNFYRNLISGTFRKAFRSTLRRLLSTPEYDFSYKGYTDKFSFFKKKSLEIQEKTLGKRLYKFIV